MAKKKRKSMKELAKGVEKFLKGKETNTDNLEQFEIVNFFIWLSVV